MPKYRQTYSLTFWVEADDIERAEDALWEIAKEELGYIVAKTCASWDVEEANEWDVE
jgi:hypothetical protein